MGAAPAKQGGSGKVVLLVLLAVLVLGGGAAAVLLLNNRNATPTTIEKPTLLTCANADGKATVTGTFVNKADRAISVSIKADFTKDGATAATGVTALANVAPGESKNFSVAGSSAGPDGFKCSVTVTGA